MAKSVDNSNPEKQLPVNIFIYVDPPVVQAGPLRYRSPLHQPVSTGYPPLSQDAHLRFQMDGLTQVVSPPWTSSQEGRRDGTRLGLGVRRELLLRSSSHFPASGDFNHLPNMLGARSSELGV